MHFEEFDDMSIHVELKPCPWCGAKPDFKAESFSHDAPKEYAIMCTAFACDVEPATQWCDTPQEAIDQWNNRRAQ